MMYDAFIDDFEEATISPGWSSFNDVSPQPNFFKITQVAGGAVGTAHSGEYAGAGARTTSTGGFGVGVIYNTAINVTEGVYCIDIAAFERPGRGGDEHAGPVIVHEQRRTRQQDQGALSPR